MRLATIVTPDGPRLHVRGRSGYVDVAQATGDPRLATLAHVLAGGPETLDVVRAVTDQDGPAVAHHHDRTGVAVSG